MLEKQTHDGESEIKIISGDAAKELMHSLDIQPLIENWMQNNAVEINQENVRTQMNWVLQTLQIPAQLSVATLNGKAVGILGYEKTAGQMPSHTPGDTPRDVYELYRASTLPAYQKKGIYSALKDHVLQEIKQKYPHALVLSTTKNDTVKKQNRERGYTPIPTETLLRLHGWTEEEIEDRQKFIEEKEQEEMRQRTWSSIAWQGLQKLWNWRRGTNAERPPNDENWEAFILDLQSKEAIGRNQ